MNKTIKHLGAVGIISSALLFTACTPQERAFVSGVAAGAIVASYSYPHYYDRPYYFYHGRYYYGGNYRNGYYYYRGQRFYGGRYYRHHRTGAHRPYYFHKGKYLYGGVYKNGYYVYRGRTYRAGHYYDKGYRYHGGRRYKAVVGQYGYKIQKVDTRTVRRR